MRLFQTLYQLGFAVKMLGQSQKHIFPNGRLMVIYHATIRKEITNSTNPS